MTIRKTNITYSFPSDSEIKALTISPESLPLLPPNSSWNITCDLTLNKGLHLPNQKGKKICDLPIKQQARYLNDCYKTIIDRYNMFGDDKIKCMFIIYEVQSGTLNLHTHANLKIDIKTNEVYSIVKLNDIVKSLGFNKLGTYIEFIKFSENRWDYLMKRETKYPIPFHILEPIAEGEA